MNNKKVNKLTYIALYIALVIVLSKIEIRVFADFRFHLGNAMCLLAGYMLSPLSGGFAAGIGSMLFDILFYTSGLGCIITFFTKFMMGFVASFVLKLLNCKMKNTNKVKSFQVIIAGIMAEIVYIILYILKTYIERHFVMSLSMEVVTPILISKLVASTLNAIVAILISTMLYKLVKETMNSFSN